MSLVRLENVEIAFAGKPVLTGADLRVEAGEKVGLIGRNGSGKSTLFRIVTGEIKPDKGVVERMRKLRMACLAQIPDIDDDTTIHDAALGRFEGLIELERRLRDLEHRMAEGDHDVMEEYSALQTEFELKDGYTYENSVRRVLFGLGFREDDLELPFSALSGGQRTRLMLALVLLEESDLLLLDEPENHLDVEAREWLEGFLKDWDKALVIISHDRYVLNAVANRIVEVERGTTRSYTGNYDAFLEAKALKAEQDEKAFADQQAFIEKEERWINRFRAKATKARQVQSRVKRLEKLERVDQPESAQGLARMMLGGVTRSGQVVLRADNLSMAYGSLRLYEGLSFQLERGDRLGILGPNGSGKSTLLRQFAGRLEGGGGRVELGHKVNIAFYDQHHQNLHEHNDILSEIQRDRPDMKPEQIRTFMGAFLFTGDDVFKKISTLSGGERARVAIAKLILTGANLLMLDEPTNHLDILTREVLEQALGDYEGTLIVVSHDRALLDSLVDRLVVLENEKAEYFRGTYSDFRERQAAAAAPVKKPDDAMKIRKQTNDRQAGKEAEKEIRKKRKRLKELEESIAETEDYIVELEGQFGLVDPSDYQKAQALKTDYESLKENVAELYKEWESLTEALEGAT